MSKSAYEDRDDLEKIQSQWTKLTGLHTRTEWSAAVVRAATAAELAANFAIRKEFKARSKFDSDFVDGLLVWANGLSGKVDRLLLPLHEGKEHHATLKELKPVTEEINKKRNSIVHQGQFCSESEATRIIQHARKFIETLTKLYKKDFILKDKKESED